MAIKRSLVRCLLTILAVPKIGVIAASISTVVGQLGAGIVIDHFGFFGGAQITFNWQRGLAIVLMLIALRLIYAGNRKSQQDWKEEPKITCN